MKITIVIDGKELACCESRGSDPDFAVVNHKLDKLLQQGEKLMADSTNALAQLERLNTVTNDMASEIDSAVAGRQDLLSQIEALKAQLGSQDAAVQAQFDDITAKLTADADSLSGVSDRLKSLGADPSNPVPPEA